MKMTKRRASAGSSERREDADDDAYEQEGGEGTKARCRQQDLARTVPPDLIAGMPHACRIPDSGHGDRPAGRCKLPRDASRIDGVTATACGTTCQPSGTREGKKEKKGKKWKNPGAGLPMAGIVCYPIITLGVWRSG